MNDQRTNEHQDAAPQGAVSAGKDAAPDKGGPDGGKQKSALSRLFDFVGELVHVVVISLAIIIPVRYFLIQPFYVKGASMEPNFQDHQYLIIDELSYRFEAPQRGQVIVFRYPNDPRQFFIKRVIGLPGERIVIGGGHVTIYNASHPKGMVLDETSYLGNTPTAGSEDIQLKDDEYFLMGDNRPESLDSRSFGPVKKSFIVGRVLFRGWPPEKITLYDHPINYSGSVTPTSSSG